MKMFIFTLLVLPLIVEEVRAGDTLLIRDITIISAERTEPLQHASVLIEDGIIREIITADSARDADRIIYGAGRYLVPDLIDSHVHLGSNAGMRGEQLRKNEAMLDSFRQREPLNYLAFGFTTLIDVAKTQRFGDAWNAQALRPDLHFCIGVPFANGYGMAFEPEETRFNTPYFLYDPDQADVIPDTIRPEDYSPTAVVKKIAKTNAICVKSYYEEGFAGLFDFPVPPLDLIRELVHEAQENNLVVLLHSNALTAQKFAVDAGIDVLAHGPWHWDQWNAEREVSGSISQILDDVVDQGMAIQVTAQVIYGECDLLDNNFLKDPRLSQIYDAELIDWYGTDAGNWFRTRMLQNYRGNPELIQRFIGHKPGGAVTEPTQAAIDRLHAAVSYLSMRDAEFVFGTDTPSSPTYTNPPGYNGLLEIHRLAELGLSEKQIFDSLTVNNAKRFGLDAVIGTVETGKRANLLLLRQNPLISISAYDALDLAIMRGNVIERAELQIGTTGSDFAATDG